MQSVTHSAPRLYVIISQTWQVAKIKQGIIVMCVSYRDYKNSKRIKYV